VFRDARRVLAQAFSAWNKDRLRILRVAWGRGTITPSGLGAVAGRLLDEGEESPALIELFSLSPETVPWEGPHMFKRALQELGAQPPDDDAKRKRPRSGCLTCCPLAA
jgi:hypothetical protein